MQEETVDIKNTNHGNAQTPPPPLPRLIVPIARRYVFARSVIVRIRQRRRIAHPPARPRSSGPPLPHIHDTHLQLSCSPFLFGPPSSRRFDRGGSRNNDSAGVSHRRFLMAPLFWYLYQLTSFLMKQMFLRQHRRGWQRDRPAARNRHHTPPEADPLTEPELPRSRLPVWAAAGGGGGVTIVLRRQKRRINDGPPSRGRAA